MNAEAVKKFFEEQKTLSSELKTLETKIKKFNQTDKSTVNWGHVGSLKHVTELVKEINEFLE